MSGVSIPNLPPAISVSGNEEIEIVQNGTSRRATVSQVFTSAVTSVSFGTTGFTPSSPTIGNVVVSGTLNVANGGTGGTNATDARTNLSAAKSGVNTDITQLGGLGNGSLSAPSLTFSSETNTGLYKSGAGDLSVSILGAQIGTFSSTGLAITGSLSMSRLNLTDSVTGTASTSTINAATTWNTTGTPTAWKLNVTDTASNASSLLMALQVGGTSRFQFSKNGALVMNNSVGGAGIQFGTGGSPYVQITQSSSPIITLGSSGSFAWRSAADVSSGANDTFLTRKAAANLQLGAADAAAPVAQNLSVQSVVAGTTNIAGANFTLNGSQGTGTGAGGAIIFRTAAAGTSGSAQNALAERMRITSAGDVGIGTSSPTARLTTVAGASQAGIYAQGGSGSLAADFLNSNATSFGVRINGGQNGYYALSVSDRVSNNLFYVDGGGNIGIGGVTSPNYKLHVNGSIASTNATAGLGYGTGAGGTITQATSRTTGVTLNTVTGSITLVSAAGTTAWQSFTVTNSTIAANDTVIVNQRSGTDLYMIHVTNVAAGSFRISFATTGGTTTEQPVFNFAVIKGATS